jgi:tetratricopeptide (TPR) repeat protein
MSTRHSAQPVKPPLARVALPWRKKLLFALVATLIFFTLLEVGLWMAGVRTIAAGDDPYVGFAAYLPLFVPQTDADGRVWMTTAPDKLAWFNEQRFPRDKEPGTRRVFCLGGSTTYGHPYDDTTSFAAWLRELLPAASDNARWEVINAGGISYASYRVAAVMQELAQYQPDLFVVYTGHNEFLEERTYGDLRRKPAWLLQAAAVLGRTRTYRVLDGLWRGEKRRSEGRAVLAAEVDAVLDHTVGPSAYQRNDAWHEQVLVHFETNLARMADLARGCGAELMLVVPAVNLKDSSPFKSEHAAGFSEPQLAEWNALTEQAAEAKRAGRLDDALGAYEQALQIDPRHAETSFRAARLLLAAGRAGEASAAFERALDEDVCPLRAPSEFRQAVRRTAASHRIPLADFDLIVKNDCLVRYGHNLPGNEYFLDHVHLTLDGYRMVAVSVIECLANYQMLGVGALAEADVARATEQIHGRIDRRQHAVAERNLAKVLNWAGKHEEAGRLALRSLETLPDEPESLVIGGAYLREQGELDRAIEYLERAVAQLPEYPDARQLLGAMLVDARRLDEAREQFLALARLRPRDAAAWQMVGAILAEQQKYAEAVGYYRRSLVLNDTDANLHYNLGFALAQLGRRDEAQHHLRRALELNPTDTAAKQTLAELKPAP